GDAAHLRSVRRDGGGGRARARRRGADRGQAPDFTARHVPDWSRPSSRSIAALAMLRDALIARLHEMGDSPDYQRLASDVLGIRGAPPDLARKLVSQALVVEDRREVWRRVGESICRDAPAAPGVYVLRDSDGRPLYVGKAANLRRRLRAHFAERRWRAIKPMMARAADADWREVGSDLEALLHEAMLIRTLEPAVNVQTG